MSRQQAEIPLETNAPARVEAQGAERPPHELFGELVSSDHGHFEQTLTSS